MRNEKPKHLLFYKDTNMLIQSGKEKLYAANIYNFKDDLPEDQKVPGMALNQQD